MDIRALSLRRFRFAKLPPGFMHETRQRLADEETKDPLTGVPIIDLENFCCGKQCCEKPNATRFIL